LVYPPLLAFFAKFAMNNFMTKIKGFSKGSQVCQSKAVTRQKKEEMILGKFYWRLNDHENVSIPVPQRYNKGVYP
jgi:hypothetical protein